MTFSDSVLVVESMVAFEKCVVTGGRGVEIRGIHCNPSFSQCEFRSSEAYGCWVKESAQVPARVPDPHQIPVCVYLHTAAAPVHTAWAQQMWTIHLNDVDHSSD